MWGIVLHRNSEIGLARQIFLSLKDRILSGQIPQGEALPSTREMAMGLAVSRNTVNDAYSMLWSEGFTVNRRGAPTRVAAGVQLPSAQKSASPQEREKKQPPILWDFKTGQPDLSLFPWQTWNELLRSAAESLTAWQYAYSDPKGYEPLCAEIAHWLLRSRSMEVDPSDIFITSGATQAFRLLTDILPQDNRAFALENPSHPGIYNMVTDHGFPLFWLPVDEQGADVAALHSQSIAAVYVTPSHQFPLGGILPARRRAALIRLAQDNDFYILEDDYDSEFRYGGAPISPLYAMDSAHVVYVGTFSKTLFPALRLGFAVVPRALQAQWKHCRNYMDVQNPVLEQAALTTFLKTRKMDRHIQRMRRAYGEKRETLLEALAAAFGDSVRPWGDDSGLHMALQFPGMRFSRHFTDKCREKSIQIATLNEYCHTPNEHQDKLLIGYGHLSAGQIQQGVLALKRIIFCMESELLYLQQEPN
jgi:GntR family transcriptional regulator/MocR family aminotransferase